MDYLDAIVLGVVEGLTEFLPVSSTGHLTLAEKVLGLPVDDTGVTAYTAVIQMGAIAAVVLYFLKDIVGIVGAWFAGVFRPSRRDTAGYRMGWLTIIGSIPIGIVGFLGKDVVSGPLRSLWWVAGALIVWSVVMIVAERLATQRRHEPDLTWKDALVVGLVQCLALVPGVSRSGATISAGLARGIDRVTATRLSFYFSIPALTAAGLYELGDVGGSGIHAGHVYVGLIVAFLVAYASVAWLLRFVSHHSIAWFTPYRVLLGAVVLVLLVTGAVSAT